MDQPTNRVGYARVSTVDQDPDAQIAALRDAGCHRVFTDTISGTERSRPQLTAALDYVRPGDVLVVWRLDRLGRSLSDLIDIVEKLGERGVEFESLSETGMTTLSPTGRLLFHMAAAFSQFERDLISERTKLGLERARQRGRYGGRPRVLDDDTIQDVRTAHERGRSIQRLARQHGVSRSTIQRALKST